ncbi:MAG: tetratricopeptide repeat protein [Propionibacteriales bacterium]|nr:tetratricopeptide repeat protein [Propionibacteriales bacterium]
MSDQFHGGAAADDGLGFGRLLREHRLAAGLSQEALAGLAGLSVDAVAALERGRRKAPRPLTVRLLADALDLDDVTRAGLIRAARQRRPAERAAIPRTPAAPDELIGRDRELTEAIQTLTGSTRMLTLTGAGGVGKTRLATALAERLRDHFADGECWVSLAPVADPSEIAVTIASAVGMPIPPGGATFDALADHFAERSALLVLDNCDHVLDACASLCEVLLKSCAGLHVLTTSRELLRIAGETVRVVAPLELPPPECPPEELERSGAIRLFLARAKDRGFTPSAGQMSEVARICRRLQGIPLAIELAAARMNVLSPRQISVELDRSLTILAGASRTAPERHHTLADAMDWSHRLLSHEERRAFAELSVFVGGWTLAAAEAVCGRRRQTGGRFDVLDVLGRLVDKSLVQVERGPSEAVRFTMLSLIREYAEAQLRESGRYDEVARAHADYHVVLAAEAELRLRGSDQQRWLDLLETELGNIRAAMSWAIRTRSEHALLIAAPLWTFCYLRGHYGEGRAWLERALGVSADKEGADQSVRAKALLGAGMMAFLQCEYALAETRIEDALRIYRGLGDRSGTALSLQRLGSIARERGDYDEARRLHSRSLFMFTAAEDGLGAVWARHHLGFVSWLRGEFAGAYRHGIRALAAFRELGDGEGVAWSLISLGAIAHYRGQPAQAEKHLTESLTLSRRLGYREGVAWALNQLGLVALRRGELDRAAGLLGESLTVNRELRDRWRSSSVVDALAAVAVRHGEVEYAAFLLAAARAERESIGTPVPWCERADHEDTMNAVRVVLDDATFTAASEAGSSASLDALEAYPARAKQPRS